MGVTAQLLDTRAAFDGVAAGYDASNEANAVIRVMRARLIREVTRRVPRGSSLIDLGCGPGRDAVTLAGLGYHVRALDWSPAMAAEAERRALDAGVAERIVVSNIGIHELERLDGSPADAAYSDLGPLNCVPDLDTTAQRISQLIRPGGWFIASVIGRCCPWELALYASHMDWTRAMIRFRRGLVRVPLEGRSVWTRYLWPSELERPFLRAGFERASLRALGLCLPPPYLTGFASRHPRLLRALERIDDAAGAWPGVRRLGDHFLIAMRRRP